MSEGFAIEDAVSSSNLGSNQSALDPVVSAGQLLRQARINAGLHVAALAVTLKVPVKRLEALEEGNMALLPDILFARALASSVCRTLNIDAAPILDKLPKAVLHRLNEAGASINKPIRISNSNDQFRWTDSIKAPWLIGVILLFCSAALIYLWPKSNPMGLFDISAITKMMPSLGSTPTAEVTSQTEAPLLASNKLLPETINSFTELSNTPAPLPPVEVTPVAGASVAESSDSGAPTNSFSLVNSNTMVPPDSIVVFKATGQTWVEVKSVNGITIFKKLLNNGDVAGAYGTLPLAVTVGRADVTQVEVRGKPIDLTSVAKSNVARFEVN